MPRTTLPGGGLEALLAALGSLCWRRPWWIVAAWLLAVVLAGGAITLLKDRLLSGSGHIAESMSERVDAQLTADFGLGDGQSLILVYRARSIAPDSPQLDEIERRIVERLASLDKVKSVVPANDLVETPSDQAGRVLVVSIAADNALVTEQQVPLVRAAIAPVFASIAQAAPDLAWAVTGRAALSHDINIFSTRDTGSAELRAMPLALLVLLGAFGAVVAAGLPLVLAFATRTLALAATLLVAGVWEVSNLAQSIGAMLAIALGIDYSLFVYHRYKQLLRYPEELPSEPSGLDLTERALRGAMAQSGRVVLYSGLAVVIGLGALLFTPLMQTRSIGIGGIGAVAFSVVGALTLLPALLSLIGTRALDWPAWIQRAHPEDRSRTLWIRWGKAVVRRPLAGIAVSLFLLGALALPALNTEFGFPEDEFLPADLESARGLDMLGAMGMKGLASPLYVVIAARDGSPVVSAERMAGLSKLVGSIQQDPRVAEVFAPSLSVESRYMPLPMPGASRLVSPGKDKILLRVVPASTTDLASLRVLASAIPSWLDDRSLSVEVGGQAQYYNDFDAQMRAAYPLILGLVLATTGLVLLVLLRAPLAAAKAILLNLASVAAGYGAVVFVFQLGHGAALFGLTEPAGLVPTSVPIVIFAILFGLSMDYEIFLISRMRTLFLRSGDNRASIVEALGDTGSVITSAALIMAVVFGAFAFSRIVIVQMIGLGLAVAILADALLIRSLLGPALMVVAGRWNWWPLQTGNEVSS